MTTFESDFLRAVDARGFIHQCSDAQGLDRVLAADGSPKLCYIGFDCTADSLHVGSLVPIMLLRWWQRSGHKPIVLMGGGTTKVGDPSGKDDSRRLLSDADIARNRAGIQAVFAQFLDFGDGPTDAVMLDNAEWLDALAYIPFLRDFGRYFSINRMLSFDSVRLRLDRRQPLSFLEFNYMILQAYDFLELHRRTGCILQMGGSDQWGNIVSGIELGRRAGQAELYGLTAPLITLASGEKMGKTAHGAVWLNAERLSAYEYYQFWRNAADADTGRFLRLFTELPLDEVAWLGRLSGEDTNEAKKILAFEATRLCRGPAAAEEAAATARTTFEDGAPADGLPTVELPRADLDAGIAAFELFRVAGLAVSGGEARRLIRGGGARINDRPAAAETARIGLSDLDDTGAIKLSAGRKRHVLVRPA